MIFLDTSGIFALADLDDVNHAVAVAMLEEVNRLDIRLLCHSYVLVESSALLQRRLGLPSAMKLLHDARRFDVRWVAEELHLRAVSELAARNKRGLSLVDVVSFLVMNEEGVDRYLGFDKHFSDEGFLPAARGEE